jgi:hypothetical protein
VVLNFDVFKAKTTEEMRFDLISFQTGMTT